ncbi:MAG: HAD family hydrolase [Candidatus Nanohalobium sp.]
MNDLEVLSGVDDFKKLEGEKVVLLDVEGTVTPGNRHVPQNPRPDHVYQMFQGETFEVKTDLGYWSGLHLLAGERPEEYFRRVDKWWNGQKSREEFEEENIQQLNDLLEKTDHETAEDLVEWYNKSFLNLRENSRDVVDIFHEAGYKVGMLSHTSESLSKTAGRELGADFVVPSWTFKFENGRFEFIEKEVYAEDKSEVVDEMEEAGVKEIVFVGNGKNDIEISNEAEKAYMVENENDVDYDEIEAYTGEFENVLDRIRSDFGGA